MSLENIIFPIVSVEPDGLQPSIRVVGSGVRIGSNGFALTAPSVMTKNAGLTLACHVARTCRSHHGSKLSEFECDPTNLIALVWVEPVVYQTLLRIPVWCRIGLEAMAVGYSEDQRIRVLGSDDELMEPRLLFSTLQQVNTRVYRGIGAEVLPMKYLNDNALAAGATVFDVEGRHPALQGIQTDTHTSKEGEVLAQITCLSRIWDWVPEALGYALRHEVFGES